MRKLLVAPVAALLLFAGAAGAITYGTPDGELHPYVGLVAFYDGDGAFLGRCSGTQLSSTVLLTAAHCTDGAASAKVWFDSVVNPAVGAIDGTPHTPSAYVPGFPNALDVGVVVLHTEVTRASYGQLAPLGTLDGLATRRGVQPVAFTGVGYGLQGIRPTLQVDLERYYATQQLVDLRSALARGLNLRLTGDPGHGGGACFGDSGGPVFHGGTSSNVVVAVSSFGLNGLCKGGSYAYRVDTLAARGFVLGFL